MAEGLDLGELRNIVRLLHGDFDGGSGRFHRLREKIRQRREHFHNLPAANPSLPPAYAGKSTYQTDFLRQTHIRHRARVTEHRPVVHVTPPRRTQDQQDKADRLEAVLNRMYDLLEQREGINFQHALSDGQNIDCYGVIHWIKVTDIWPELPEREIREVLPEDPNEAKRFSAERDDDGEETGRYEETDDSLQDRNRKTKAAAGAPWHVEVVDPRKFAFVEDRSTANGLGVVVLRKEVGLIEYNQALRGENRYVSLNQENKNLRVYLERDRPDEQISVSDEAYWGETIHVAEVWTRDYFYELVGNHQTNWELVKSSKHPYGMPPFAIAYGSRINDSDPVLAYEPTLEGVFRQKPSFDRVMAMNEIIAEAIAMPMWWIETAEGLPALDDEGKPIVLSRDTLAATQLPPGAKLVKADFEINSGFINLLNIRRQELEDAAPAVGLAEVTGSTQAWAILLQQQQASLEPKQQVFEQQKALRTMLRNMTMVMSLPAEDGGFGQPVPVYAKMKDGTIDTTTVIWVEPEDIETLEVELKIQPRSSAEVITNTEFGLGMFDRGRITEREWREEFKGDEQPQEKMDELLVEQIFNEFLRPEVIKQKLAEKFENFVVLGPDGSFVGLGGDAILPEDVLSMNGQQPIPTAPTRAGSSSGFGLGSPGSSPGALPDLVAPGTVPQRGIRGI